MKRTKEKFSDVIEKHQPQKKKGKKYNWEKIREEKNGRGWKILCNLESFYLMVKRIILNSV